MGKKIENNSSKKDRIYRSVEIKKKNWMAENLDTETFKNGDAILYIEDDSSWEKAGVDGTPAWCWYTNSINIGKKFGKLYNWYAVNDPRGLAPDGWRIPTDNEWMDLNIFNLFSIFAPTAGKNLKSTFDWGSHNGSDKYGFSGLPGGMRQADGKSEFIYQFGLFWTSTPNKNNAFYYNLREMDNKIGRGELNKASGLSVRCIKK